MRKITIPVLILFLITGFFWFFPGFANAGSATLTWQTNTEPDLSGYRIYYGTKSRSYGLPIHVGKATSYTVTGLDEGAKYYFSITAVDTSGNESGFSQEVSKTIPSSAAPPLLEPHIEIGTVAIDHQWFYVEFKNPFDDPVVIAKPLSFNGENPATIRVLNLSANGFHVKIQEWMYLDQVHLKEAISYLVIEKGHYRLADGHEIEAGKILTNKADLSGSFEQVKFSSPFESIPIVASTVLTFNGTNPVVTRNRNVGKGGFEVVMEEEEGSDRVHMLETIGYVAWEAGKGKVGEISYHVGSFQGVDHHWATMSYGPFQTNPNLIMDLQTTIGTDTANLRYINKSTGQVQLKVCEEESRDPETEHVAEVVGYFAFR